MIPTSTTKILPCIHRSWARQRKCCQKNPERSFQSSGTQATCSRGRCGLAGRISYHEGRQGCCNSRRRKPSSSSGLALIRVTLKIRDTMTNFSILPYYVRFTRINWWQFFAHVHANLRAYISYCYYSMIFPISFKVSYILSYKL